MNGQNPQDRGRRLTEEALNKEFTIKFTRGELLALFNLMHSVQHSLPNAEVFLAIRDKIKGPVTALSNQDYEGAEIVPTEGVVTN